MCFALLVVSLQSLYSAHKDWILDMCMIPGSDVMTSCCRSGTVKLWSAEACSQLDEVKAHSSSVNALTASESNVITASRLLFHLYIRTDDDIAVCFNSSFIAVTVTAL